MTQRIIHTYYYLSSPIFFMRSSSPTRINIQHYLMPLFYRVGVENGNVLLCLHLYIFGIQKLPLKHSILSGVTNIRETSLHAR